MLQQDQVLEQGSGSGVLEGPQEFESGLLGTGAKTAEGVVNSRLPERELNLPRSIGKGAHITMGRAAKKDLSTAGRVAHATHGSRIGGQPSGRSKRQHKDLVREARSSPRDALHYREDFGLALTDETHASAVESERKFGEYTNEVRNLLGQERQSIASGRQQVESEWKSAQSSLGSERDNAIKQLDDQRNKAMQQLGGPKTIEQAYQDAYKNDFHAFWVVGGTMSNPGEVEAKYKAPVAFLEKAFPALAEGGYQVVNNRIYVGRRGQEVHDLARGLESEAKKQYYDTAGPQVQQYNAQVMRQQQNLNNEYDAAMGDIQQQYTKTFRDVQSQYMDATSQLSQREGAALGREQGLNLEIQNRQEELQEIRQSYQDRLGRIDEALSLNIERTAASRSQAQPVQRLDPRMPGTQQQG